MSEKHNDKPKDSPEILHNLAVVPLYRQLRLLIEGEIEKGRWRLDETIPTEEKLSKMFGVSRVTVRTALDELSSEGILIRIRGKGTFVAKVKEKKFMVMRHESFTDFCKRNGLTPSRKLIELNIKEPTAIDIAELRLKSNEKIIRFVAVLYGNGIPLIYADNRIRSDFAYLLDKDLEHNSLNELMKASGIVKKLVFLKKTIEGCIGASDEAEHLKTYKGAPLLVSWDLVGDENGVPVRLTKWLVSSDKVGFVFHIN